MVDRCEITFIWCDPDSAAIRSSASIFPQTEALSLFRTISGSTAIVGNRSSGDIKGATRENSLGARTRKAWTGRGTFLR